MFDLINFLLGPAVPVSAVARRSGMLEIDSEDCADIIFHHVEGIQTSLHVDYVTSPSIRAIEVVGTEASIRGDLKQRQLEVIDRDGNPIETRSSGGSIAEDYLKEMEAFIEPHRNEGLQRGDGRDGLRVLEQVLTARQMAGLPTC